jgi:hypothetical protein
MEFIVNVHISMKNKIKIKVIQVDATKYGAAI